ncbi:hypothetical protein VNO77_42402 [Canavalia gladiata]|uniref:Membrane protein of ER body-like protein n=1 Tax=Canavalia gladiata TaxID=3824 RepID=A0AAN9PND8_CANGL
MANQWNEAEFEVEEVGLQRKRSLQHSSSSSSSNEDIDVKDGDLEFHESKTKEIFNIITTQVNSEMILPREDKETTKEIFNLITTQVNAEMILPHEDKETSTILPTSDAPLLVDSTSLNNVTPEIGTVGTIKENDKDMHELYLEKVFKKSPPHGFYCPNCKSCIEKVYVKKGEWELANTPTQTLTQSEPIRCSSCFSFLIPIGSWLFPGLVSEVPALNDQVTGSPNNKRQPQGSVEEVKVTSQYEASELHQSVARGTSKLAISITDDKGKQSLQITEEVGSKISNTELGSISGENKKSEDSSNDLSATSQEQGKSQVAPKKKHFWNNWAVIRRASEASIPKQPKTGSPKNSDWRVITATSGATIVEQPIIDIPEKKQPEQVEVRIDEAYPEAGEEVEASGDSTPFLPQRLEILKSIVYGGLNESLASLSIVTSAASADAATLNILALAIANLIGGLFVLGHNLRELKNEKPKRGENNTHESMDQYNQLLGQRENFYLHGFIAILSFIVFGLVPPLVYGFSFRESDDKDFKLVAVAGASLLCITLLSIAKAYIKRPNTYLTYFQTVLFYVSTGAVASVLSYLAGNLGKKLLENLGWFESTPKLALQISGIDAQQLRLASYQ